MGHTQGRFFLIVLDGVRYGVFILSLRRHNIIHGLWGYIMGERAGLKECFDEKRLVLRMDALVCWLRIYASNGNKQHTDKTKYSSIGNRRKEQTTKKEKKSST